MGKLGSRRGFTLIELVVVIAVLAILAGVVVPRVSTHVAASRDARRLRDIEMVRAAVERYFLDKGTYPAPTQNASYGGWDVSHDGDFIRALCEEGYLDREVLDPINDETFHYRYYLYSKGSYGCKSSTDFYVLGIRSFESGEFASRNRGFFECQNRDWGAEFAYVTGGGATFGD